MAEPWSVVSERLKDLTPEEQSRARDLYFQKVIEPTLGVDAERGRKLFYANAKLPSEKLAEQTAKPTPIEQVPPTTWESIGAGLYKTLAMAPQQAYAWATGDDAGLKQSEADMAMFEEAQKKSKPFIVSQPTWTTAGEIAPLAVAGMAPEAILARAGMASVPAGAGLVSKGLQYAGRGALSGTAASIPQYVGEGDSKLKQIGAGAVTGAIAEPVAAAFGKGLSEALSPDLVPDAAALAQKAKRFDIPLMTTDVSPPTTAVGKFAKQGVPEKIPFAGTGGMRATQQSRRIGAISELYDEFGVDASLPKMSESVMDDLAKTRGDAIQTQKLKKQAVIDSVSSDKSTVPLDNTIKAIDGKIAELQSLNNRDVQPVIDILEQYKSAFSSNNLKRLEENRKLFGAKIKEFELGSVGRDVGDKAVSDVYGALRQDMGRYIKTQGGQGYYNRWEQANSTLKGMVEELDKTGLKTALNKGDVTPELVDTLLFSKKPSDLAILNKNLSPVGRDNAKKAIIQRIQAGAKTATESGDVISPEKFVAQVEQNREAIKAFFHGDGLAQIDGLVQVINATRHAGTATKLPTTGYQQLMYAIPGGLFATGMSFGGVAGGAGLTAAAGAAGRAYESNLARNLLISLGKVKPNSPQAKVILQRLNTVVASGAAGLQNRGE